MRLPRLNLTRRPQAALGFDEADDAIEPVALFQIGHHERPLAAHPFRVGVHLLQRRADIGREVDLVDDQEIRPGDARSDLLVINKIDLAPYVGASLEKMDTDAKRMRGERPFVMTNLKKSEGLDRIISFIENKGGLRPATGTKG